jgi:hypothetical protein
MLVLILPNIVAFAEGKMTSFIERLCGWQPAPRINRTDGNSYPDTFDVKLAGGQVAQCTSLFRVTYTNLVISTGYAEGAGDDPIYLRIERVDDPELVTTLFMRPDEMMAVVQAATAILWNMSIDVLKEEHEAIARLKAEGEKEQ